MKPGYKQTEVGVIPEEWDVKRLGELAVLKNGYAFKSDTYTTLGNFKIITIANVQDGFMTARECNSIACEPKDLQSHQRLQIGDILISMTGNVGRVCRVIEKNCLLNQRVGKLIPTAVYDDMLFILLGQPSFIKAMTGVAKGGAQPNLSVSEISDHRFCVPASLPEQRAIATALSDVDGLLGGLDRLIAKKRDLKQAAMQQLLTGQTRLPGFHAEWEVKRLGEICEIAMGRTPPRLNQAYWGHGFKWLSIADLQTKVASDSKEEITELAASMMTIIPKGTLLMSFKLSLGRLCFAGCDLFTNEAICSFNKLQANAEFLYYVLGRTDFSLYGKQAVKGYTLNKESLKIIEVTLPSVPEQTAIAEVLTDMDAELAALEQRREKTRALKQAMMQELLTGRTRLV